MRYAHLITAAIGLAAILAVAAGTVALPSSDAVLGETIDGIEYDIEGIYAVVSGYHGAGGTVTIPAQVTIGDETYPVVTIKDNVNPFRTHPGITGFAVDASNAYFSSADGVLFSASGDVLYAYPSGSDRTSYTVPSGVLSISKYAFGSCTYLEQVDLDPGMKKISDHSFSGCTSLKTVSMPSNLVSIGQYSFEGCGMLDDVVMPDTVTNLGIGAFKDCVSLRDITLSKGLKVVSADAFRGCTSIDTLVLPASVDTIYNNAFLGCSSLTHLNIVCARLSTLTTTSFCIGTSSDPVECYVNCSTPDFDPCGYTDANTLIHFNEEKFTLRLYSMGSLFAEHEIGCGEPVDLEIPTRTGYSISSWTDSRGIPAEYPEYMPAQDMDLYVVWSPVQYLVVFHSNDGSERSYTQSITYDHETDLIAGRFSQEHMCYVGWRDSSDNHYDDGQAVLNLSTGDPFHLYAEWAPPDYIIHYVSDKGEGTMPDQPFLGGDYYQISANIFESEGFVFYGWSGSNGLKYMDKQKVRDLGTGGEIVTFTAIWEPIKYAVKFDLQGGTGSSQTIIATYGESYSVPTNVAKGGCYLRGWSLNPDSADPEIGPGSTFGNLTSEDGKIVTLYAIWGTNIYTVIYHANGGSGEMDKQFVTYGDTPNLMKCVFSKVYSDFVGWAESPDGVVIYADKARLPSSIVLENNTLNLYAIWVNWTYTIHFNANGAEGTMAAIGAECNTDVQLPLCTFTSETSFKGWSLTPGGKIVYADGAVVNNLSEGASSVTLYASWVIPPEPPVDPVIGGDDIPVVAIAVGSLVLIAVVAGAVFVFRKYHA